MSGTRVGHLKQLLFNRNVLYSTVRTIIIRNAFFKLYAVVNPNIGLNDVFTRRFERLQPSAYTSTRKLNWKEKNNHRYSNIITIIMNTNLSVRTLFTFLLPSCTSVAQFLHIPRTSPSFLCALFFFHLYRRDTSLDVRT